MVKMKLGTQDALQLIQRLHNPLRPLLLGPGQMIYEVVLTWGGFSRSFARLCDNVSSLPLAHPCTSYASIPPTIPATISRPLPHYLNQRRNKQLPCPYWEALPRLPPTSPWYSHPAKVPSVFCCHNTIRRYLLEISCSLAIELSSGCLLQIPLTSVCSYKTQPSPCHPAD